MKNAFLVGLIGILVAAFAVPAVLSAENDATSSAPVASAQEASPPPAPQGVSGATPDIRPPAPDTWVCPKCGEASPYQKRYKQRMGRPQFGAQAQRRDGQRGGRGDGFCEPRKGHRHDFDRGRGHGRRAGRGAQRGVAADRMLRQAEALELTDDQIAKLEMLSYEAKKKLIDLHASIEKEQLELKNRIRSDAEDMTQIKRHLSAISSAKVGIQEVKISNLFAARKILTDEQKKLVKEKHPRMGMNLD